MTTGNDTKDEESDTKEEENDTKEEMNHSGIGQVYHYVAGNEGD